MQRWARGVQRLDHSSPVGGKGVGAKGAGKKLQAAERVGTQSTSKEEGRLCCAVARVMGSRGLGMCLFT